MDDVLLMKELTSFGNDVRRDLIADGMSRPKPLTDQQLMMRLTSYGNDYIATAAKDPDNVNAVIWCDIYFGDPAEVGMTWAWNPFRPVDPVTGEEGFWRIWSETHPDVGSLTKCQEEFAAYCVQHGAMAQ